MKIQLIRNATLKLQYAGKTILVDPMLSPKGALPSFAGKANNPIVELPIGTDNILKGIDAVLVTHTHPDHWDQAAIDLLPKDTQLFIQPIDKEKISNAEFTNIIPIESRSEWEGITFNRTGGKHGSGEILKMMGEVSGFVLQASGEPTVYIVGDSIWNDEVRTAIDLYKPTVIVTNSGGAIKPRYETTPILMDATETLLVADAAPNAKIVAVHLESLDHCTVTRQGLRSLALEKGISGERLLIPEDGENIFLS